VSPAELQVMSEIGECLTRQGQILERIGSLLDRPSKVEDWLMTREEAMAYLKVGSTTLYEFMRGPEQLPYYKMRGILLFRKRDLDAWLEKYKGGAA
jgi:excisionase family DNA binding protein